MTSNQWITAWIIAILLMIGSLPFSDTAFAQGFQNDQITIVEIGGNTLRVPTKYFLGTNPRAREVPGIFIKALSPSMGPMQENNKDEFLYAKGLGRTVGIGIGDSKTRTSLPFRLEASRKFGVPYEQRPDQYGMHVYIPAESATANKGTLRQELYSAEDQGTLRSYIRCRRDGDVPYPTCSHEFLYRQFLVDVILNKHRLPEWRAIQQEVKDLIDRFSDGS
jgi:hypothetical protein